MEVDLTSPHGDRVKALRKLTTTQGRKKSHSFLAEGPQNCREAAAAGHLQELYATPEALDRHADITSLANAARTRIRTCTPEVMAALSDTVTTQGMVGVCDTLDRNLGEVLTAQARLVAVLSCVRDPGNAGTILRTADAAGADLVIFTAESVDLYNPKCVRSTAGSLFHVPVVTGVELEPTLRTLREHGIHILATSGEGPADLHQLATHPQSALNRPCAWVFGNEASGLGRDEQNLADTTVRIPIYGQAESLNLATAAAICLYASAQAHRLAAR